LCVILQHARRQGRRLPETRRFPSRSHRSTRCRSRRGLQAQWRSQRGAATRTRQSCGCRLARTSTIRKPVPSFRDTRLRQPPRGRCPSGKPAPFPFTTPRHTRQASRGLTCLVRKFINRSSRRRSCELRNCKQRCGSVRVGVDGVCKRPFSSPNSLRKCMLPPVNAGPYRLLPPRSTAHSSKAARRRSPGIRQWPAWSTAARPSHSMA